MSWEHTHYKATCVACGRKGVCIESSDDWNRLATSWEGFNCRPPDPTAVGRKRVDARQSVGVCQCGSTRFTLGDVIKRC